MRVLNFPASSSCRPLLRILHSPARNPFNPPHLQVSLDRDRNHVVTYYLILSNHARHASPQATSLRDLCVLRVSALDSSSLGLTLNLQSEVRRLSRPEIPTRSGLSTFNPVSFLSPSSPHLCVLCGENSLSFRSSLIPRHSPLTTNSFIIRTSRTPLPQLLYNPHLRAPLGSAGNKGLITPLESALTKNSPVSLLESALAETPGVGPCFDSGTRHSSLATGFKFFYFHTLPSSFALAKSSTLLFSYNSSLFAQNTGGGGR